MRDADDGGDGFPWEKHGVVGHMYADRFCTDCAAEIRLLRDGPVSIAGGKAPDGMLSASRGLSLDQGVDLIGEVLDVSGRGGIDEKPLQVLTVLKVLAGCVLDFFAHRDSEHADGPGMRKVPQDRAAGKGQRMRSADRPLFRVVGEDLPDAFRLGEGKRFPDGAVDGVLRKFFHLRRQSRLAHHFFLVDLEQCSVK